MGVVKMSSGLDLRKRGARRDRDTYTGKSQRPSPLTAIDAGTPGDIRVNNDAMMALHHLYHSSPSIQAARCILQGQLLSSGCVVRRSGSDVELKDTFSRHLEDVWLPFARSVIDSFLMFGFVVVSLEEEGPPPFANFVKGKKMAATSNMAPQVDVERSEPLSAKEVRARQLPITDDSRVDANTTNSKINCSVNLIPNVPDIGQYEISFVHVGATGYRREYSIFATNSDNIYRQDFSSEVFFKTPPDVAGNVCSPIATVFQSASFISALEELALQAEVVRARQMLVTQPVQRSAGNNNLDPANLFFDSESRAVQASSAADEDAAQASSLAMQAKMMQIINRLQTTDPGTGRERPMPGSSTSAGVSNHIPPPVPPQLFAAPGKENAPRLVDTSHKPLNAFSRVQTGSRSFQAFAHPRPAPTSST